MNPSEYVKNVLVTEATDLTPAKGRVTKDVTLRLLHASAGITSEIAELIELLEASKHGELDTVNLLEEIGDVCWYMGVAADALNATAEIFATPDKLVGYSSPVAALRREIPTLTQLSGTFVDLVFKKHVMYGKEFNPAVLVQVLTKVNTSLIEILDSAGMTIEEAREKNIAKLRARYGSKFTEAAALNRDLETERKTLEEK